MTYLIKYVYDLNLHVFDINTGINESEKLTKHISSKCKCKFDGRKCCLNQKWNNNTCQSECKNRKEHNACNKIIFGILLHVLVKMENM